MSIFMLFPQPRRSLPKFPLKPLATPWESEPSVDCSNILCARWKSNAFPQDLPEIVRIDVTNLNIGESLHVRDIPLPSGVESLTDADLTVVSVVASRVGEEVTEAAETLAAPEVITEKKGEAKQEPPQS